MSSTAVGFLAVLLAVTGPQDSRPSAQADTQADQQESSRPDTVHLPRCLVSLIDDVQVPAEEAGRLIALEVREGDQVRQGDKIAQIDDRVAQQSQKLAQVELNKAKQLADNDVNIRHSRAEAAVAQVEYQQAVDANAKIQGAVSQAETRRRQLEAGRTKLAIEQAEFEQTSAAMDVESKQAELQAAQLQLKLRQVLAPFDGVVVQSHRKDGEWVNPGDPVVHLVRINRLGIEDFVDAAKFGPQEIRGRPVQIVATLERGRVEKFAGRVTFVSPIVQAGGVYRVRAEVDNRQASGEWILRPGLQVDMTILLKDAKTVAKK